MPLTATATRAQLADQTRNPRRQVAGGAALGGQVLHLQLIYEGKNVIWEDIFDALEAKFGAGKVTSDKDTMGRGTLIFRIKP